MQSPVKGQIPATHPAKEHIEEVVAENGLLQLFLLKAKSAQGAEVIYALIDFCHNRQQTLKVKAHL